MNQRDDAQQSDAKKTTQRVTVYRNVTLIDGTGGPQRRNVSVTVTGEYITAVSEMGGTETDASEASGAESAVSETGGPETADAERFERDPDVNVVDLAGCFLLPGLIDSHQHVATPPDRPRAEKILRRHLYSGITAIRDMADDLRQVADLTRATRVGEIPGPDIYYAALIAGASFFDDPRTHEVTRGTDTASVPWMQAITDETDLREAVCLARGTSATAIKIYSNLAAERVAAITAEAHRQGMQVWAHGMVFPTAPAQVVEAGVDALSHARYLGYQLLKQRPGSYQERFPIDEAEFSAADKAPLTQIFQEMRSRGTVLDATHQVWRYLSEVSDSRHAAPGWDTQAEISAEIIRLAHAEGVDISTGTDYETNLQERFPALHLELAALVNEIGMSPREVIRSATLVGAMSMGQQHQMGTVAVGKLANLLIVTADPEADIANLQRVAFTVKRGIRYDRSEFETSDRPFIINALGVLDNPNPANERKSGGKLVKHAGDLTVDARALSDSKASGMTAVNITVGHTSGDGDPFQLTIDDIDAWDAVLDAHPGELLKVKTAHDIRRAHREEKIGVIYGFQNGTMLGEDPSRVAEFVERGVRVFQLTYNPNNQLADGSMSQRNHGLTSLGRDVIAELNRHRVMVDLSHSGQNTCLEAVRASSQPISINHTGCRALTDLPRNKTDEELRLVVESGGFVGIYFMPFLNESGHASAEDVVSHIVHAVNVCGEDHVGIGTDGSVTSIDDLETYRSQLAEHVRMRVAAGAGSTGERADTYPFVEDLRGVDQFRRLARLLDGVGFSSARVEKILGLNFLAYADRIWA